MPLTGTCRVYMYVTYHMNMCLTANMLRPILPTPMSGDAWRWQRSTKHHLAGIMYD